VAASIGPLPPGRSRAAMVAEVTANLATLREGATVVVACSGGPDSSALAHLVADARPDLALVLVHVAHGLRARAAEEADREVVATHASWVAAELVGCDVEVTTSGRGVEAAARDARYRALREVAAQRGACAILVGHSADDQAETVLLRIARGTGTDGLAAMAIVAGDLLRPLLRLRRADLLAFVAGEGLPVAADETNRDEAIRRVRVRREVLPALARIGPDPVATLGRLAALARDDAAALAAADAAVPDAVRRVGPVVALRSEALGTVPVAIARRLVRRALGELVEVPPSAATVTRILEARAGDAATLPGAVEFRAEHGWRTFVVVDAAAGAAASLRTAAGRGPSTGSEPSAWRVELASPGRWSWAPAGLSLRLLAPGADGSTLGIGSDHEPDPHDRVADDAPAASQIALALPGVWVPPPHRVPSGRIAPGTVAGRYDVTLPGEGAGLVVRATAPGDRIRGSGGTRRVVEVLREAGMPRAIRSRWPIVVERGSGGRVVWIPGVAADAERLAAGRRQPGLAIHVTPS
jgi:tRNA(Ile)-lysidine synthase